MKIAYFDCFSGISGDMTLGAFLDAGLNPRALKRELGKLKLSGYEIRTRRVRRGSITGTKFDCILKPSRSARHGHATLKHILSLIQRSALSKSVKERACGIFLTLGRAEGRIHGSRLESVHFHEVGNLDSIVDIVGTAIAADELGIERFYSAHPPLGMGRIATQAGVMPVPSPAALEILKGVPIRASNAESELVTPTGASILRTLVSSFGPMPSMRVDRIGYGAGSADPEEMPNMLRMVIGSSGGTYKTDSVILLETNIDDMSPQALGDLLQRLPEEGVLDAYITPVQMKKSRPGFLLSVLCEERLLEKIAGMIFEETTSIGIRYNRIERLKLERRIVKIDTKYGKVRVKFSGDTVSPEYEDCAVIARKRRIPFKEVYDEAKRHA